MNLAGRNIYYLWQFHWSSSIYFGLFSKKKQHFQTWYLSLSHRQFGHLKDVKLGLRFMSIVFCFVFKILKATYQSSFVGICWPWSWNFLVPQKEWLLHSRLINSIPSFFNLNFTIEYLKVKCGILLHTPYSIIAHPYRL